MRCEDFEARLNDVLDERRPPASDLELSHHVHQCGACREVWRGYEAMLAGLSYEHVPPAPVWVAERAVKEVLVKTESLVKAIADRTTADRVSRWHARLLPAFALAASMLVAAGLAWWNHSPRPLQNKFANVGNLPERVVKQRQSGQPGAPAVDTRPAVPAGDVAANSNHRDVTEADPMLGILPAGQWAPAGAEWAQEVADGLQPVTQPTVGAISGFLNLWGVAQEGHRS